MTNSPARKVAGTAIDAQSKTFAVQLMKHLVVPTFVLDSHGRVIIWNTELERLTGVMASEVLGTSEHWRGFYAEKRPCLADFVLNEDYNAEALYSEVLLASKSEHRISAENWCKFPYVDAQRYLAIDAGPIFAEDGELLAVVETLRDITDQKEAQLALEQLARRDGLTGLANRREFDDALDAAWRGRTETGAHVGLLLIDIDHFKEFNDHHGHQAGDDCLKQVAGILQSVVSSPDDLAARYGGEEFALVLPAAGSGSISAVAKRVRTAINAASIPHECTKAGHLTVSIGASSTEHGPASIADLVGAADAALYKAKDAGRDRIEIH